MSDYIERERVKKFIEEGLNNPDKEKAFGHDAVEILAEVEYMDAAPVRPVVRGKWEETDNPDVCCCTVCNTPFYRPDAYIYYFCPNCGADMRKGEEGLDV